MKILICGDSFCINDINFPGLHFTEKISATLPHAEICNLAIGGASNALITTQFMQGLTLDPDFVIFSFTHPTRYEYDNKQPTALESTTAQSFLDYNKQRWITNCFESDINVKLKNVTLNKWLHTAASFEFELLKNYFYVALCLLTCQTKNIPFCFSLGGCEHYWKENVIGNNYLIDIIQANNTCKLPTNLWDHHQGRTLSPTFHVDNDKVQTQFANECIKFICKTAPEGNCDYD